MHLKKIKLAGFKSFVDPTTIPITNSMTGVVGPNGCGKSNIIDAIRWVMGESSAKHLRGDSLADVIFSGSNSRKPVGKATVELIFDNTDGKAPGQFASYAEISIRREAGRDGTSDYFLNKTKCRKKDIVDLFLGTGLGPRNYSIIEQGMVTRIIESRPEDLRGFLEEAAGISRYKERRRETENRIRHTRENLDRVNDIRSELEKQIERLNRQAKAAVRYKELKQEERLTQAQMLALRYRDLDQRLQGIESELSANQVTLDKLVAEQREIEAAIEAIRSRRTDATDHFNRVQEEFYGLGGEISTIEQSIQHARESREQQLREQEEVNRAWDEASQHLRTDEVRIAELRDRLAQGEAEMVVRLEARDRTAADQARTEQAMQAWQQDWDIFSEAAAEPAKVRDIQNARIAQLRQHLAQLGERETRLMEEAERIATAMGGEDLDALRQQSREQDRRCDDLATRLDTLEQQIREQRAERQQLADELEDRRGERQQITARLTSLRELQDAAQGKDDDELRQWLTAQGLNDAPRLAGRIKVEAGWEKAVERVLGTALSAVCVDDLARYRDALGTLADTNVMLVSTAKVDAPVAGEGRKRLASLVQGDAPIAGLLGRVYVAESLDQAFAQRDGLGADESIIAPDGSWLGRHWISLAKSNDARSGVLRREQEIRKLESQLAGEDGEIAARQGSLQEIEARLDDYELQRDDTRRGLNDANRERAALFERLGHKEAQQEQLGSRRDQIGREIDELRQQVSTDTRELDLAGRLLHEAEGASGQHEQRRAQLLAQRDALGTAREQAREAASRARDAWYQIEMDRQRMQTELDSTRQAVERLTTQLQGLTQRREQLEKVLAEGGAPEEQLKAKLQELLKKRLEVESRLNEARQAASAVEDEMRAKEKARGEQEKRIQEHRDGMEHIRVRRQESLVRRDTLVEQLRETGHTLDEARADLPDDATEAAWKEKLEGIERRINRLGPINLVAIEEFEQESERKNYLDKQYDDLTQALTTLEEAMRKIDRETRTRFKETFDKVNSGMQQFFPQLFGGGHAYLELTDDDLLTTGVAVMARPPGKRNSTIHLLSGGEKALTAVALLFAIFELNPAPFCLLDEVDAPLDDANVERYAQTLKQLSANTQLIYVTHNKISMEMADVLIGVTMSEPGVSRLVAVDVDEAMEMVAV